MRRRTWAVVFGIVLAAAGAVVGVVVATGLGGGDTTRPSGAETVLRIQPADDEVSCGAGPAAVYIYLDDLEARPSPRQADASYGVDAFEFPLRYDPQIVRIGQPINVQLNPQLDQEDADRDGVVRSFLLLSDIDDFAGWAMLGAASIVPSSQRPEDNLEEGLDPVAKGEPLLLMTVRFTPVGHGTTAIAFGDAESGLPSTFREAGLGDPAGKLYEPLVLKGASLTVAGGDCPAPPPATPRPTVRPTVTPYIPPTPTPVVWRTVTAPEAPVAGRTDCPRDWVAYVDPQDRFSICYPADFSATASDFALNAHSPRTAGETRNLLSVVVSWEVTPGTIYYPPSRDTCPMYSVMGQKSSAFLELTVAGKIVPACLNQGVLESGDPIASLQGAVPLANDGSEREGFIRFAVSFTGPDLSRGRALGETLIQTLSLQFR